MADNVACSEFLTWRRGLSETGTTVSISPVRRSKSFSEDASPLTTTETARQAAEILAAWKAKPEDGSNYFCPPRRIAARTSATEAKSPTARRVRRLLRGVDRGETAMQALDASAVRDINRTYRRTASTMGPKDSFLTRILTKSRTARRGFDGMRRLSAGLRRTLSFSLDEDTVSYVKPHSDAVIRALTPFVSTSLYREIYSAHRPASGDDLSASLRGDLFTQPSMKKIRGAVMVADVCGFTRLTDQLGKQGRAGVELLTKLINHYLTEAIDLVVAHGGDVIKFAGDSLIVAFYEDEAEASVSDDAFRGALNRCLQCSQELSHKLGRVQMLPNGEIRPVLRSVGSGGVLESLRKRTSRGAAGLRSSFAGTTSESRIPSGHSFHSTTSTRPNDGRDPSQNQSLAGSAPSGLRSDSPFMPSSPQQTSLFHRIVRPLVRLASRSFAESGHATEVRTKQETRGGSVRFSPDTPDNSEQPLYRGSTFWKNGSASATSSPSANFRDVLEEGEMHLKVLVGCGDYVLFRVGGGLEGGDAAAAPMTRWEYIVADEPNAAAQMIDGHPFRQPLRQIAEIEHHANEEDVIVSEEVLKVLHPQPASLVDYSALQILSRGFEYEALDGAARIKGQMTRNAPTPTGKEVPDMALFPSRIRRRCADALRMHVIDKVRQKIELGYVDYISEIRQLSVLFFGFPGLSSPDEEKARSPLQNVQRVAETLQKYMRQFEGSFVQFRCDEKGFLAICAFGLAGSQHKDNAARAVTAALKITAAVQRLSFDACVGVTTGDLLCACIGSRHRAEYTLFGNAVNLSARLMCKAKKGMGTVLCDTATKDRAKRKAQYLPLEEVRVKGLEDPVVVYLVKPAEGNLPSRGSLQSEFNHPMVGRETLMGKLMSRLNAFAETGEGGVVLVEGEAGSGKTKLVTEAQLELHGKYGSGLNVFYSCGAAEETSLPLFPWRRVFEGMFLHDAKEGRLPDDDGETLLGKALATELPQYMTVMRGFLAAALEVELHVMPRGEETDSGGAVPRMASFPFGRPVSMARQISDSTLSRSRSGSGRSSVSTGVRSASRRRRSSTAGNTLLRRQMVLDYFLLIAQIFAQLYGPFLLVMENIQHFDSLSWELLNAISGSQDNSVLSLVTVRRSDSRRSVDGASGKAALRGRTDAEVDALLEKGRALCLTLEPLDAKATADLVRALSSGTAVSDTVVRYIHDKSSGSPLYIEQLTQYLRTQELLDATVLENGLAPAEGLLNFLRQSVTIQQMLLERLDQLAPTTHLTLKVASVIGRNITAELLEAVYPFAVPLAVLALNLEELEAIGFLKTEDDDVWNFKSMLDRDAVNDVVPQSQRRFLHSRLAATLSSGAYPRVAHAIIAYHWEQSCLGVEALEPDRLLKAIRWWNKAANDAYDKLAPVEALQLFRKVASLAALPSVVVRKSRQKRHSRPGAVLWKKRQRVHAEDSFAVTRLLKAQWARKMSRLCLNVAAQAVTSDQRLDVTNEAAVHALEGLRHLDVPIPEISALPPIAPVSIRRSAFRRRRRPPSTLYVEEVARLLEGLLQCSQLFMPYVDSVHKHCRRR